MSNEIKFRLHKTYPWAIKQDIKLQFINTVNKLARIVECKMMLPSCNFLLWEGYAIKHHHKGARHQLNLSVSLYKTEDDSVPTLLKRATHVQVKIQDEEIYLSMNNEGDELFIYEYFPIELVADHIVTSLKG